MGVGSPRSMNEYVLWQPAELQRLKRVHFETSNALRRSQGDLRNEQQRSALLAASISSLQSDLADLFVQHSQQLSELHAERERYRGEAEAIVEKERKANALLRIRNEELESTAANNETLCSLAEARATCDTLRKELESARDASARNEDRIRADSETMRREAESEVRRLVGETRVLRQRLEDMSGSIQLEREQAQGDVLVILREIAALSADLREIGADASTKGASGTDVGVSQLRFLRSRIEQAWRRTEEGWDCARKAQDALRHAEEQAANDRSALDQKLKLARADAYSANAKLDSVRERLSEMARLESDRLREVEEVLRSAQAHAMATEERAGAAELRASLLASELAQEQHRSASANAEVERCKASQGERDVQLARLNERLERALGMLAEQAHSLADEQQRSAALSAEIGRAHV
jgi:chromosome segregation ATPase